MSAPRRALGTLALGTLGLSLACASGGPATRPVRLVAQQPEVDQALAEARGAAVASTPQGLSAAESALRRMLAAHPSSNLAPVARLLLVRVLIARDQLSAARIELSRVDTRVDPDLTPQTQIVHGVLDAREAAQARNTDDHRAHLREARGLVLPLDGTRPDPAETVELSCALAECATIEPDSALAVLTLARALSAVERAEASGTLWVRTGLRCEDPAARAQLLDDVAARVDELPALARAIDASTPASPLRRALAERLLERARQARQTARFANYFADLSDDRAAQDAPGEGDSATAVIGLMIPLSGPRAAIGTSILRGAQLALERAPGVRLVLEDEGLEPAESVAAVDRLHAQGARAMIGPSRDRLAPGAAIRAASLGVPLFLLAVPPGIEATGALIRPAAPPTLDRAEALARAVREVIRSPRALVIASSFSERRASAERGSELIADASEEALLRSGVLASSVWFDAFVLPRRAGFTPLVVGDLGREHRLVVAHALEALRGRAVLDARAAMGDQRADEPDGPSDPRTPGVWVGVRGAPALPSRVAQWCARYGESPDETALLAHDAALLAAEALRRTTGLAPAALDPERALVTSTIVRGAPWSPSMPAAAARCPAPDGAPAPHVAP
jgi:hypothetical protein